MDKALNFNYMKYADGTMSRPSGVSDEDSFYEMKVIVQVPALHFALLFCMMYSYVD